MDFNPLKTYTLEVAIKILINQDLDFYPLTSEERKFWNSFAQWERSMLMTGSPIRIPKWRTQLCSSEYFYTSSIAALEAISVPIEFAEV